MNGVNDHYPNDGDSIASTNKIFLKFQNNPAAINLLLNEAERRGLYKRQFRRDFRPVKDKNTSR